MKLLTGLAGLMVALAPYVSSGQQQPSIPDYDYRFVKQSNFWTFLAPSKENVTWKSYKHKVRNSPPMEETVLHGFASLDFSRDGMKKYNLSLGFISKIRADERHGTISSIENIVYERDPKKRKCTDFDYEVALRNGIDTTNLMEVNCDIIDSRKHTVTNPKNDSSFSIPPGVVDYQTAFYNFRDYLMRSKVEKLDTSITVVYRHALHTMDVQVFRDDDELKVSLDMTVPDEKDKDSRKQVVPGIESIEFTLDENYMVSAATGKGSILFIPISVTVKRE